MGVCRLVCIDYSYGTSVKRSFILLSLQANRESVSKDHFFYWRHEARQNILASDAGIDISGNHSGLFLIIFIAAKLRVKSECSLAEVFHIMPAHIVFFRIAHRFDTGPFDFDD